VTSIDEPITGDTAAGKLSRNIIGSMSQFFSDSLSEKTKDSMKAAVKSGRFIWVSPVGFLNERNGSGSIIKPDPERAALVRKGFELMGTGGHSADDALRTVTALGLIKTKLTGNLTAEDFDSLKATNTTDAAVIDQQLNALESEKNMMQELIEQSQRELVDLVSAWRKAGISGRKELQTALFQ
jgi:hypothetical protein